MPYYDAIVIGGGVVGAAAAYHLVSGGARTLLVDRADEGRATDAGAGIISPETNTRDPAAWFDLAIRAPEYYEDLIPKLQAEQEHDTGFAAGGSLLVAVDEDEEAPYQAAREAILSRQQRRGSPWADDLKEVTAEEAQDLLPALARPRGAILNRIARRVDGRQLSLALLAAAESRGLDLRRAAVQRLLTRDTAVAGVIVDGGEIEAGATAIAGGAWSEAFGAQLGLQIPLEPQRGQIIHLHLADTDTSRWPIIHALRGHYLVPWPDGRVVVGATRETGSGFRPVPTAAGVREVLSEALRVAPGLASATLLETRVGLRPLTSDTLPVLGPVPGWRGIFLATGHGPTGLTIGALSAKLVAELILGLDSAIDIGAFHISRFE